MRKSEAIRNIYVYYWFKLFCEPLMWGTILTLFLQHTAHVSLSLIFIMESVCVIGLMFLQVPGGALADMIGRRRTLQLGMGLFMIKMVVFSLAINPLMAWIANAIWVLGYALIDGADSALLYDNLKFLGREHEFHRIEGNANAYRWILTGFCSVGSGYLAQYNLRWPLFIDVLVMVVGFCACYFFVEPPIGQKRKGISGYLDLMKVSVLFVANHRQVKWIIAFTVLIGVVSKMWFFTYNPFFELVGLPIKHFGWIFLPLNLTAAFSSHYNGWISRKLGDFGSVVMMITLVAVPILLMGIFPIKALVWLVILQNLVRGYMGPFLGQFLHHYLDSENRATVTSVKSAVRGLAEFVMLGAYGLLLRAYDLSVCLEILGIFMCLSGLLLIISYLRIFGREACR